MTSFPTAVGPTASDTPALAALTESLRKQYRDSVKYVLAYGSCLRSGDIYDGLLDLYLIVDSYSSAYGHGLRATSNWLLPPNVFYAQQEHEGRILRCKYALVSSADFARANSPRSFESYFWGRFSQPIGVVWERNAQQRFELDAVLQQAVGSFLSAALPALPEQGSLEQLWSDGLSLSYNTELRSERSGRATELASSSRQHFETVTELMQIPSLQLSRNGSQLDYQSRYNSLQRRWAKLAWPLRAMSGKLRSILRLIKALFTFAGGLDYIAWKLERHSGQKVEIPDRVRRFPLIFVWGFCWQLYRRGIFK
jgi:hypothetical protein